MKRFSPRYAIPLDFARPRGARLLEGFSLKLARRVRLFDHAAFDQWIRLEADASVLSLCERPARLAAATDARLVDFWVLRHDGEELLLVDDGELGTQTVDGIALRQVKAGELAASATWIANWQHMLPVITMCRALLSSSLKRAVLHTVREPAALSRIEHALSAEEPPLVRAAIFDLLRTGQLRAPSLHMKLLSLQTLVEPVP